MKNIAMFIHKLLEKEVGSVSGSDTLDNEGKGAFLFKAENEEIKVKIVLTSESNERI